MKRLFIDSDIFVRDLRYPRDSRTEENRRFLDKVLSKKIHGCTSIFNLLEVCGILSYNLSPTDLFDLYAGFTQEYPVQILFPADSTGNLQYDIPTIFSQVQRKNSLGDAQIAYVVERFTDHLSGFVTWNVKHFEGKLPIPVKCPNEL